MRRYTTSYLTCVSDRSCLRVYNLEREAWVDIPIVFAATLAIVLAWSGTAKLRAPLAFATALRGFGVPATLAPGVAWLTITAELIIAALLALALAGVVPPIIGSSAALVLFGTFSAAIVAAARRGSRTPCHCFGEEDSEVASFATLARAVVLATMAFAVGLAGVVTVQSADRAGATVTIAIGGAIVLRMWSYAAAGWIWLTRPTTAYMPPTRRVTYRYSEPLSSLFEAEALAIGERASLTPADVEVRS
jgi:hypothetical protein